MRRIEHLYVLTLALLLAHEVDSAYWQEWRLFGIPGGIQLFVVLNLALIVPALVGLVRVAQAGRGWAGFSLVLAGLGALTFGIHLGLLLMGHREFGVPASWAVLGGVLLASVSLGWQAIVKGRRTNVGAAM